MNKKVDEQFKYIYDEYLLQCICTELKDKIEEKDKEIERLDKELGDANYTITQLHKVMDRHYVKKEDYDRLNNIIDEMEIFFKNAFDKEVRSLGSYKVSVWTICLDKLKELKEGKKC